MSEAGKRGKAEGEEAHYSYSAVNQTVSLLCIFFLCVGFRYGLSYRFA